MAHPARSGGPILPPLMAPQQQPSWKQEVRPDLEPQAAAEPAPPAEAAPEKPEGEK
jgi:hypothetical protein